MNTNAVNNILMEGIKYAEDFGIAMWSMGPFPLTLVGCLILGMVAKAVANITPYGAPKTRKVLVPVLVVVTGGALFSNLSDPHITAFQPNEMSNPMVRLWIIGMVAGFAAIVIHRKFIKDTKFEKWVTLENGSGDTTFTENPNKPNESTKE